MGADAGVFAGGEYDEDDKEADRVWEAVDAHMDERRRVRRGAGGHGGRWGGARPRCRQACVCVCAVHVWGGGAARTGSVCAAEWQAWLV